MWFKRSARSDITKITFAVPFERVPAPVSVVGEFNGWDPTTHPLKWGRDGSRSITIPLPAGHTYEYLFVTPDGEYFTDPEAPTVANDHGGMNSLVTT